MDFNANNPIVKLCIQGMQLEAQGESDNAGKLFLQAWDESTHVFEKFTAAYHVARRQTESSERIRWWETTLQLAQKINDNAVRPGFPVIYSALAECYERMDDARIAEKHRQLANTFVITPSDNGPFYHGTKADLQVGDLLTPGKMSNYQDDLKMNHIYFTALASGARLAAALAKGNGRERVFIVEPTGEFEDDPNVTNKRFLGNPTRSYRTASPLKIVGEINDGKSTEEDEVKNWRDRLANNKGEIIN